MGKTFGTQRVVTAGGTLVCALGIGYFMQATAQTSADADIAHTQINTSAIASLPKAAAVVEQPIADMHASAIDDLSLTEIQLTSAENEKPTAVILSSLEFDETTFELASLDDDAAGETGLPDKQDPFAQASSCDIEFIAIKTHAASVMLELSAPCSPDERFTLHHNGMMFSDVTDPYGAWEMTIPALSEQAVFFASFGDDETAEVKVEVDTLAYYDRYVVQWRGDKSLQIHALEFGADYGDAGHVWAQSPHSIDDAAKGEAGYVMRLGEPSLDEALIAEVYTFPTEIALTPGEVKISVEAEVTAANCGRDVDAQILSRQEGGRFKGRDLVLAMPECDTIGEFLVLQNLYEDLTIASN